VTTDPRRDTPSVIGKYLGRFDRSFVGLTASLSTIRRAMNDLHIAYNGTRRTAGGGYEVEHGTQLTGFVGTQARVEWNQLTTVADLRSDLTELAAVARR
jgi:protein SCO1/2